MNNITVFLGGSCFGIFLTMFIAYLDTKIANGRDIGFKSESKFKCYLVATCWELQFLIAGILFGKIIL